MERVAFQLRIRRGKETEYDEAHRRVWPELLREMEEIGITDYSIFRRGQLLFLYMHVPKFADVLAKLGASDVNRRWQEAMAPLFEPVLDLQPGEQFAMMQEVFFMSGDRTVQAALQRTEKVGEA
ncbi:MAG: L-rhamnose mutarotase [Acidobacteriaceae bacterium]